MERDHYDNPGVVVWRGIMLNKWTQLHVFDRCSVTEDRYCKEGTLFYVRLFKSAIGPDFVFMVDNPRPYPIADVHQLLERLCTFTGFLKVKLLINITTLTSFLNSVKSGLKRRIFESIEAVKEKAARFQKEMTQEDFQYCFEQWKNCMEHCRDRVLDAYGKVPSGTLRGNFLWIGKYEECVDVHVDTDRNDSHSEIDGIYCVATWNVTLPNNFNLPLQQLPVKTGLCLPESCSSLDIKQDIRHLVSLLRSLPFLGEYGELLDFHSMICKDTFPRLSVPARIFLYILGAYFSFIVAGSCITLYEYIRSSYTSSSKCTKEQSNVFTDFVSDEGDAHFIVGESFTELLITKKSGSLLSNGAFQRCFKGSSHFLRCFCLFSNTAKVLDTNTTANTFSCIHGIRFFSMAWVILGHTYIHNTNIIGNYLDLLHSIDNLPFQTVTQVDFCFVICFLKNPTKEMGK
ncbi:nose resistant to fluoxetine protein 6 [Trichonephila clavipes]|nr:nose resistant to fluoxetine protein 6 [Trichonephila clavipes]